MQRSIYVPRSETLKKKCNCALYKKIIRVDSWLLYKRFITHHFVTSSEDLIHGPSPVFSQLLELVSSEVLRALQKQCLADQPTTSVKLFEF